MGILRKLFGKKTPINKLSSKGPFYELSKSPLDAPEIFGLEWALDGLFENEKLYLKQVIDLMNKCLEHHCFYIFNTPYTIERLRLDKNYLFATYFEVLNYNFVITQHHFKKMEFREKLEDSLFEIIASQFSIHGDLILKKYFDEDDSISFIQDLMYHKHEIYENIIDAIKSEKTKLELMSLYENIIERPFSNDYNSKIKLNLKFQEKAIQSLEFATYFSKNSSYYYSNLQKLNLVSID